MNYQIKILLFLALLLSGNKAMAFEGEITYEMVDNSAPLAKKSKIKLGIKKGLLRIDYIFYFTNGEGKTSAIIDYSTRKAVFIKNKKSEVIDLNQPFKQNNFMMPEELTPTKNEKTIIGFKTQEYETFYFVKDVRLPLKTWYSQHSIFESFFPVWHLHKIHPEMALINFFLNPVSKRISLEMSYTRIDKKQITYRCIQIEKKVLNEQYFKAI